MCDDVDKLAGTSASKLISSVSCIRQTLLLLSSVGFAHVINLRLIKMLKLFS
jgi:hypothetical protein